MSNLDDQTRFAIEWQCSQLCNAFAYHIDHQQFEQLVQLFAPDGVFHREGVELIGHDAIRSAYAKRPTNVTIRHLVSNFMPLEVTASRVEASVCVTTIHAFAVSDGPVTYSPTGATRVLEFTDEFRLTAQGWRFAKRIPRPVLMTPEWPGKP